MILLSWWFENNNSCLVNRILLTTNRNLFDEVHQYLGTHIILYLPKTCALKQLDLKELHLWKSFLGEQLFMRLYSVVRLLVNKQDEELK